MSVSYRFTRVSCHMAKWEFLKDLETFLIISSFFKILYHLFLSCNLPSIILIPSRCSFWDTTLPRYYIQNWNIFWNLIESSSHANFLRLNHRSSSILRGTPQSSVSLASWMIDYRFKNIIGRVENSISQE